MASRKTTGNGKPRNKSAHPLDAHFGTRIERKRLEKGMSARELGEEIAVSGVQIRKYETGVNSMTAARLYDAAKALDVPTGYFFDDVSPETEEARQQYLTEQRATSRRK